MRNILHVLASIFVSFTREKKMSDRFEKQSGFTLVEMSIVLVIIGLLIGSVLKGQSLIDSAKVKILSLDFRNIPPLIYNYKDKFRALPGDDAAAATHLKGGAIASTPGTAGNGILEGNWDSTTKTDETFLLWQHLRLAGLMSGPTDLSTVTDATTAGIFLPKNEDGGQIGIESAAAHYIRDPGAVTTFLQGTYVICSSGILGKFAKQLDTTLDDGDIQTGALRVVSIGHTRGYAAEFKTAELDDDTQYVVCMGV
jgi:prepilin-type N-terminal cleavage/methylation domain-containing protein